MDPRTGDVRQVPNTPEGQKEIIEKHLIPLKRGMKMTIRFESAPDRVFNYTLASWGKKSMVIKYVGEEKSK